MAEQREEIKTEMAQQTASAENNSTDKLKGKDSRRKIFYIAPQKKGRLLKSLL